MNEKVKKLFDSIVVDFDEIYNEVYINKDFMDNCITQTVKNTKVNMRRAFELEQAGINVNSPEFNTLSNKMIKQQVVLMKPLQRKLIAIRYSRLKDFSNLSEEDYAELEFSLSEYTLFKVKDFAEELKSLTMSKIASISAEFVDEQMSLIDRKDCDCGGDCTCGCKIHDIREGDDTKPFGTNIGHA